MLLDPETLALAPGVEKLLGLSFGRARPLKGLKTELFSCLIETNTPVCESVERRGRSSSGFGARCARQLPAKVSRLPGLARIRSRGQRIRRSWPSRAT